jgi:amino acid transporter
MTSETPGAEAAPHRFSRSLSGFGVIILTLSVLSPGVSIFVSGGSILQQAGTGAVLAFLVGTVVCFCQTTLIAELGAAYPTAGYDNAAIGHAVGDWAGATAYMQGIVGIPLFLNTSAIGIATYLHPFGLPFSDHTITFATIALITVLSLLNIRSNEYVTSLFMVIEVVALLLVAGVGAWHASPDAVSLITHPVRIEGGAFAAVAIGVIGIGTTNAAWAIAGSNQALYFSEDMKRPETIGRIIMISFGIAAFLEFVPVLGTIIGSHDLKAVLSSDNPFEVFLAQHMSVFFVKFVSGAIAIAIFNACLAGFVGIGRNVFSMGRTKLFSQPINQALMKMIPSTEAPWVAILLIGASTAAVTYLSLSFKILLLSGNTAIVAAFYFIGVWRGRRSGRTGRGTYRSPLFPLMPILGAVIFVGEVIVMGMDDMGRKSMAISIGVWILAFCYYRFVLMRRPGGWQLIGPEDVDRAAAAHAATMGDQALPITA